MPVSIDIAPVPVTIAPQNIQAIITGTGNNYGQIKYIKDGFLDKFSGQSIVYTSGTGAIFKSGIPIGKLSSIDDNSTNKLNVDFFSDFSDGGRRSRKNSNCEGSS